MAQYFDADGKRVAKSTGTAKRREAVKIAEGWEAEERDRKRRSADVPKALSHLLEMGLREAASGHLTLARFEELLRRGYVVANPTHREVSVGGWLDEWVDKQTAYVTAGSLEVYRNSMARLRDALGRHADEPLADLTAGNLRAAMLKMRETVAASTVNQSLKLIRSASRAAIADKLISANVAAQVRPLPPNGTIKKTAFTVGEVRQLIDGCATYRPFKTAGIVDEFQGLILLAAHTGLRLSDLLRLEAKHLSDDRSELSLLPQKTARSGDLLTVPLSPPVMGWIGARGGALFPALSRLGRSSVGNSFRRLMEDAKVPREVTVAGDVTARRSFHSLRHSFTSWLADADVHSDVRQKLTGHKSAAIHGQYTHADEALKRAVATLPTP